MKWMCVVKFIYYFFCVVKCREQMNTYQMEFQNFKPIDPQLNSFSMVDCGDDCDTTVFDKIYAVLKILIIVSIIVVITLIIISRAGGKKSKEFLDKHKCNPVVMPFVSFFDSSINATDNFNECSYKSSKGFFSILSKPMMKMMSGFTNSMVTMRESLDTLHTGSLYTADTVTTRLNDTFEQVNKAESIMTVMLYKTKAIFDKVGAFVLNLYYILITLFDFTNLILALPDIVYNGLKMVMVVLIVLTAVLIGLFVFFTAQAFGYSLVFAFPAASYASFTAGTYLMGSIISTVFASIYIAIFAPISKAYKNADKHSYCCFSEDTLISMNHSETKKISELQLYDVLENNTIVTGILKVATHTEDWYEYKGIKVAGNHFVYDDDKKWVRVCESSNSKKIDGIIPMRYCLVTDKHFIYTPAAVFSDFQETGDPEVLTSLSTDVMETLHSFNDYSENVTQKYEIGEYGKGLPPTTHIKTSVGNIPISQIQIGTQLENENNYVVGIYHTSLKQVTGSIINGCCWIPSHSIIKKNNKWVKIYSQKLDKSISPSDEGVYLITTSGKFTIVGKEKNEIVIRDLVEYKNYIV